MENKKEFREIGSRLRDLRKAHRFSQSQVASRVRKSKQTISHYESGRCEIPITSLIAFSSLFSVDLNWLIKGESGPDLM